jgi:hypothetical protein
MGKKNKFSSGFKATPGRADWENICPPNEFRVLDEVTARGYGMVPPNMNNVNSVIVGASGSTAGTIMYFANMYRIDGTEVDQEPYFELYQSGSTVPALYGIIHHADYSGRTMPLTAVQQGMIAASGSTADISFMSKPTKNQGTLEELRNENKIYGFDFTYDQGMKKGAGLP